MRAEFSFIKSSKRETKEALKASHVKRKPDLFESSVHVRCSDTVHAFYYYPCAGGEVLHQMAVCTWASEHLPNAGTGSKHTNIICDHLLTLCFVLFWVFCISSSPPSGWLSVAMGTGLKWAAQINTLSFAPLPGVSKQRSPRMTLHSQSELGRGPCRGRARIHQPLFV